MEKNILIDEVKVHYSESGPADACPVLLLHGWGCNNKTLASIQRIVEQKYHTFNLDLPGFGDSTEPPAVWGVEDYTRLVEKFCEKLGLKAPILLGHSFGGRISILMSSRHPEIEKIILTDAAGIKPRRSLKYHVKVKSFKLLKKIMPIILGERKGKEWIEAYRSKRSSADYSSASPMMRAILSKCVNEDLKHVMPNIKASTLLVWGEEDTATPLRDAKTMERLIPDAGLVSFKGCGHYSFLDNPIQYAAVIRNFLKI